MFYILLFFAATGWADEIYVSTDVENPEYIYKIHGGRQNQTVFWSSIGGNVTSADAAEFAFFKGATDDIYYIYSVTDKTYLTYDITTDSNGNETVASDRNQTKSTASRDEAGTWKIVEVTGYSGTYQFSPTKSDNTTAISTYANWHGGLGSNHTSMGFYTTAGNGDAGSAWGIDLTEASYSTISYNLTATIGTETETFTGTTKGVPNKKILVEGILNGLSTFVLSNAQWSEDGNSVTADITLPFPTTPTYMYGDPSGIACYMYANGNNVKTRRYDEPESLPTNQTGENEKWEWQIEPSLENGVFSFKIKNLSEGKYIVTSSASSTSLALGEEANATIYGYGSTGINNGYGFYDTTNTGVFISVNTSNTGERDAIAWPKSGTSHRGSNLTFVTPADFTTLKANLEAAYTKAEPYTAGNGTGEYSGANEGFATAKEHAKAISEDTEYARAADFTTYTTALDITNLTLNQPTPGFYYIKNKATGAYVKGENVHNTETKMQTEKSKDAIFYINEDKNIMAYETGAYWRAVYYMGVGQVEGYNFEYKDYWTFESSNTIGQYALKYGASEGKNSEHYATSNSTTATFWTDTPTEDNASWILEPVEELPLAIGSNGWTTFSAPMAVTLPSDVKAYYVDSEKKDDGKIELTEINGAIPANTGIIIKSESTEGDITLTVTTDEPAEITGNKLKANVDANNITETSSDGKYALATKNSTGETGFMKLNTTKFILGGHKCYLDLGGSAAAASFLPIFTEDDLTGINSAETTTTNSDATIYDLQGRKVTGTQKGRIYIQNGKAFIAK